MVSPGVRRAYAEEIRAAAGTSSKGLLAAFRRVPREQFLGPGPWRIIAQAPLGSRQLQIRDVSDPSELYHDVAVVLDAARSLTNGNPGTLARWLDALDLTPGKSVFHLGGGSGYYTAVMAEMVGPAGRVTAVEADSTLAAMARRNLAQWPQVESLEGDGGTVDVGARDVILINVGVTHPAPTWLDGLRPGGRLVVPLTVDVGLPHIGKGLVLQITKAAGGYAARFFPVPVMIYSCTSVRDAALAQLLGRALRSGTASDVRSLRRDQHEPAQTCWLHAAEFCLSKAPVA